MVLLLVAMMLLGGTVLVIGFFIWVIREHLHARLYRRSRLVALAQPVQTVKPEGWTITTRNGKKTTVPGATEEEAVKAFILGGGDMTKIQTITRN